MVVGGIEERGRWLVSVEGSEKGGVEIGGWRVRRRWWWEVLLLRD